MLSRCCRGERTTNWWNRTWHRWINKLAPARGGERATHRKLIETDSGISLWFILLIKAGGEKSHKINTRADVLVQFTVHILRRTIKSLLIALAVFFFGGCLRNKTLRGIFSIKASLACQTRLDGCWLFCFLFPLRSTFFSTLLPSSRRYAREWRFIIHIINLNVSSLSKHKLVCLSEATLNEKKYVKLHSERQLEKLLLWDLKGSTRCTRQMTDFLLAPPSSTALN